MTARATPVGTFLDDGYQCLIAFAADSDVSFWEKTVTPPGIDGEEKIDTTTMFNTTWRTFAARQLKTLTDGSLTAAYDPKVIAQINALVNVTTEITLHYPDSSNIKFYGYLKSFTPGELSEGEQPEADCEFAVTNRNPLTGLEAGPVYSATGT